MAADQRIIIQIRERMTDELAAVVQYTAHAAYADEWQYPALAAYLREHAGDEQKHYDALNRWLVYLGEPLQPVAPSRVNISEDVQRMHEFDLTGEELAIANYKALIKLCIEAGDSETRAVIEQILADETDHRRDQKARLRQIEQTGMQNYLSSQLGGA